MLVSSRVGLAPHHASVGKLPSSLYKGVVPQTNGRGGAQIYEKHQRVWLGTFNREEDAFRAYDRATLKFRGREAIINFCPARGGDLEDRFMSVYNKEAIVDMLRKHTYDEELEYHRKRIMMTTARSVAMKNAEASGSEGSGRRAIVYQENQAASDGNGNAVTSGAAMVGLPREYLFDKAVTPSDVGKLYLMLQQSGNPHSEAARVHLGPRKNPTCLYRSLVVAEVEMLFLRLLVAEINTCEQTR